MDLDEKPDMLHFFLLLQVDLVNSYRMEEAEEPDMPCLSLFSYADLVNS